MTAKRKIPQIKITIPRGELDDIEAAMKWDGIGKLSQFALAAIRQRVRRIKREIEVEKSEFSKHDPNPKGR